VFDCAFVLHRKHESLATPKLAAEVDRERLLPLHNVTTRRLFHKIDIFVLCSVASAPAHFNRTKKVDLKAPSCSIAALPPPQTIGDVKLE
jgi:hypothetical protein